MARYLLTHSLLASWLYTMKENPRADATNEKDRLGDFMLALRREPTPTPTTMRMQHGIDFENLVVAILTGQESVVFHKFDAKTEELLQTLCVPTSEHIWATPAAVIAEIISGSRLQHRATKEIQVGDMTILLYGRLDALKAGEIYDIKFSKGYDRGKYLDSTQHPTYLELVPEAQGFTYLVSNGSEVWTERYRRDESPSIFPVISDFLDWLQVTCLMGTYKERWLAK